MSNPRTKIENGKLYQEDLSQKPIGDCFYCRTPVYAAPGQSIKMLKRTARTPQGEVISVREYPTHKRCRKNAK
jgi:hypothetical protein